MFQGAKVHGLVALGAEWLSYQSDNEHTLPTIDFAIDYCGIP